MLLNPVELETTFCLFYDVTILLLLLLVILQLFMAYVYEPFLYILEYARLDFISQRVFQADTRIHWTHILEHDSTRIQVFPERHDYHNLKHVLMLVYN